MVKYFNNMIPINLLNIKVLKNFISELNRKKILEDVKLNFRENLHVSDLKSGKETKANLHMLHKETHWKEFFNKLKKTLNNEKIAKCWALKVDQKEDNFYHNHPHMISTVFYLQNEDYYLGTHLKENDSEIIIPGHENSLLIFNGHITHDCVFPNYNLKKSRYTLITDFIAAND